MKILIYIYIFIIGACFGSFFNVVGLRISDGKSIIRPRSSCPKCGHELSFWELIPILNFFILGGKCRKCKTRISTKYVLFEIVTAMLFVYSYYMFGFCGDFFISLLLISLIVIISVSDLEYMLIEDKVIFFFLIVFLILRIFIKLPSDFSTFGLPTYVESLIGGAFGFGLLYWIAFIGRKVYNQEVMGGGDIKLYGIIGLVIGVKMTFISLLFASILGTIIGLTLSGLKIIKRDNPIPFGPFIGLGSLCTYFYGYDILHWYLNLFWNM
ncbi:prepilin peptidase [Mycoplasmatota bacterium]|nr:prepilin peptidase [Mycoplasmatota bacterium]